MEKEDIKPEDDLELEDEDPEEELEEDIEYDLELENEDPEEELEEDIEDHEDDGMGDWNELDIDEDVP